MRTQLNSELNRYLLQKPSSSLGTLEKYILMGVNSPIYSAGFSYKPEETQGPLSVSEGGGVEAWTSSKIISAVQRLSSIRTLDHIA